MGKRSSGTFARRPKDPLSDPRPPLVPFLHRDRIRTFAEPCAGAGDLVRHLEAHGLTCVYAGDIADGRDALAVERFPAEIVTNPPWTRAVLHPLIAHFMASAPFAWLLFDADWAHTKQSTALIQHCSLILPIGRVRWIPGTRDVGKDNVAWYKFQREHTGGPIHLPFRCNAQRVTAPMQPMRRAVPSAALRLSLLPRHLPPACAPGAAKRDTAVTSQTKEDETMTNVQEDWESRRESRQADNYLREAIFHAYAASARLERQGRWPLAARKRENAADVTEHKRRALSLTGHRILARIEIELAEHGGNDNGKLPVQ
ncbi:MAG: hypothetical protein ACJ8DK_19020 [Microvirga sp.]